MGKVWSTSLMYNYFLNIINIKANFLMTIDVSIPSMYAFIVVM